MIKVVAKLVITNNAIQKYFVPFYIYVKTALIEEELPRLPL